ncbi:cobalamin B12-binding domain-containing protein [Tranquillimonas rosea]|uniref:cobalamin B12-binding domain-containing protein n=1 Tax=Tranquillimonas rosea TaxID=641238 RepID=UPI003BA9552E
MPEDQARRAMPEWQDTGAPVSSLASRALSVLAARRGARVTGLSEPFLSELEETVRHGGVDDRRRLIDRMRAARLDDVALADHYIPEVARRMGAAWCEDSMSFAEVTIGSARLQGMLREIGESWATARRAGGGPSVAVIVPADEYHTLGAMVLTGQLRRRGVSVRLVLGRPEPELRAMVASLHFDAIFLSISHTEKVAQASAMVDTVRSAARSSIPVVIGGVAMKDDSETMALTGADHATNDPDEALCRCGLVVGGARQTRSGGG